MLHRTQIATRTSLLMIKLRAFRKGDSAIANVDALMDRRGGIGRRSVVDSNCRHGYCSEEITKLIDEVLKIGLPIM